MPIPFEPDNDPLQIQPGLTTIVSVGEVTLEGDLGLFVEQTDGIFTDYKIENRYENDLHRYMMGQTSPLPFKGRTVAFVQLVSPTLLWVADWTAAKVGTKPAIPNPNVGDSDWVLLDKHYDLAQVTLAADGSSPLYRISGTFVYGNSSPDPETLRELTFPRPPWLEDSLPTGRDVEASLQQQNIINRQTASSANRQTFGN